MGAVVEKLFRFRSALPQEPAIDAWVSGRGATLGPIVGRWVTQLRQLGPDVRELMHDGCPTFCAGDVAFAYVNAFTAHVNLGLYLGALLDDPADLLEGTGKRMRHVKLRPDVDVDSVALQRLIEDAYTHACRAGL